MKRLKIAIISLILIIIVILISITLIKPKDEEEINLNKEAEYYKNYIAIDNIVYENESVTNSYFIVKNILIKYNSYCKNLNKKANDIEVYREATNEEALNKYKEEMAIQEQNNAMQYVYNVLDIAYINEFNITKEDLKEKFKNQDGDEIVIKRMHIVQNSLNIFTYFVEGICINTISSHTSEFYCAVNLDMSDRTFSIYPQEYLQKHGYTNLNIGTELKIDIESIKNRENNTFESQLIDDDIVCKEYLSNYKYRMIYDTDKAYEILDEEYRKAKFGSLDGFKQYVNDNKERISSITLDKYQKTIKDDYTQYVCIDTNGNYYIFRETAVMQYKLLLDTYTIDIPEFTEKYNKADNETKVGMNIEKILTALNNKDYNYIYSKLASSFKNNYFPTIDSLKQYMQTNLFEKNTIEYDTVDNEGENYMFDIEFNNAKDSTSSPVAKRIIMQLKDGTDFVFSFNVD